MKPNVLMLGWEHPPFFNGGLGVASTALAEQLAELVSLKMVVPKSGISPKRPPYELIGLNTIELPPRNIELERVIEERLKQVKVHFVKVDLQGYEIVPRTLYKKKITEEYLVLEKKLFEEKEAQGPFEIENLYGEDLLEKVFEYSEAVSALAGQWDFDLIHAHDWMTFLAGLQLKSLTSKPLLLHVHSLQYDRAGSRNRDQIYQIERHAMQHADGVVAVSAYTTKVIHRYYGIPQEKIHVVHNGVSPTKTQRLSKPFREKLVVFLGRLTGQKGPGYFFRAAREILKRRRDVRFLIAGKGELIQPLIEATAEEGLGDRIHFTGFLEPDRVRELLAMADLYVMPSVSEPFGLSALEAAQMGVPVVISETSGVGEVLKHAIAVDYLQTEKMAKIITGILDDPIWHREIVQNQEKDLQDASWHLSAQKLTDIYRNLIGKDSPADADHLPLFSGPSTP